VSVVLAGTEDHPQARIVLSAGLEAGPSHAYLFHGAAGTGKRTVARSFAAELLAEGQPDPDAVRLRVQHGTHPDLTWVRPSGAHVMRVTTWTRRSSPRPRGRRSRRLGACSCSSAWTR